jgi:hemin uptake protein HemP
MQLALPDDEILIRHTGVLYDGLYTHLRREVL